MNVLDFIEPPNSLDLNPWTTLFGGRALQQLVYRQKIEDLEHLKQVLNSHWERISQELKMWSHKLCAIFWTTL